MLKCGLCGWFFPRFPRFFPTMGKMSFFKRKRGMIFSFSLLLTLVSFFFLLFPKKSPIFPKNVGFSGKLWEKHCFALVFAVLLQRRRNKTTLKWFGDLETTSDYFIIWILKSWEWCSRARPSLYRVKEWEHTTHYQFHWFKITWISFYLLTEWSEWRNLRR